MGGLRLHVLGPAFGLPSIDADCIAAVALVKQNVRDGDWSIVPTHEQSRRLPYLKCDDGAHYEGYGNIVRYIDEEYNQGRDSLDNAQRANSTAISSFISTNAQTLLDITLYVSSENYSHTRSAYTRILPWYSNYILPPSRRKASRLRTDHLGISSIDVDDVHEDLSNKPPGIAQDVGKEEKQFEPEIHKRASLLLGGRETVRSLLRRPEHSAVFKLHALADNFFGLLQDMLGENTYLLGDGAPTAVDCLAYGYLSLMQYPDMPQDWLAKTLAKKYGKLLRYLERLHRELAVETKAENVMALASCRSDEEVRAARQARKIDLPWCAPPTSSFVEGTTTITKDLLARIPHLTSPTTIIPMRTQPIPTWRKYALLISGLTVTSLGLSLYFVFKTGLLVWPHGEAVHIFGKKRFSDYGHLGAALAGVGLMGQQAQGEKAFQQTEESVLPGYAGVEVEVQEKGAR